MIQKEQLLTVSIIIPVYAVSDYIERCITSVMNQTYGSIECIIVDDVSPDDSMVKCERLINNYQGPIRFVILHHEKNRGLSAARNTGTDAATSDYIFYLDSDDEITSDCIEKMVRPILDDATIEMVMGNHEIYIQHPSQNLVKQERTRLPEGDYKPSAIVRDLFVNEKYDGHAWNKLIKRDFLLQNQLYFREGILWEDLLWSFFVMKHLNHLYIIPEVTLFYYIRPKSIITGTEFKKKAYHLEKIYSEIANNFTKGEEGGEAKKYLRGFCSNFINSYDSPTSKQTAQLFLNALSCKPYTSERTYLKFVIILSKFSLGRKIFAVARSTRKALKGECY